MPLTIEPVTYKDYMYKTAYENVMSLESLKERACAGRSGSTARLNGYRISGQIDEMRVKDGKVAGRREEDHRGGRKLDRQLHEAAHRPGHALQEDDGQT